MHVESTLARAPRTSRAIAISRAGARGDEGTNHNDRLAFFEHQATTDFGVERT